jgi:3D (Asp-Asp-Asp) domain-containing protein
MKLGNFKMSIKNKMLIYLTLLMVGMLSYWGEAIMFVGNEQQVEKLKVKKEILIQEQETLQNELQEIIKKENVEKTKDMEFSKMMSEMKGQVMEISAYSELDSCHYPTKDGKCLVASGKIAEIGMVASNLFPFGTKLLIGGQEYVVEDRISKRYNNRLDIWQGYGEEAYQTALQKGIQYKEVVKL